MLSRLADIKTACRCSLVEYLESWGFYCYDHETDDELRAAAIENFKTERC